ncbi:MAG: molybdenum ABC transporter ATP-binding protein [Pseudomonadales bacterium]|nr:molybdenum ABC transporter ATP-binding protein [Pseudomonadales bacterium]
MSSSQSEVGIRGQYRVGFHREAEAAFELDVCFDIPGRGVTAVFGASGSGKTTLLRCIAGLLHPDSGRLQVNGDTWQSEQFCLPAYRRPYGYVFQEASLFPHLTAEQNLGFAMKRAQGDGDVIQYPDAIALLGIRPLLNRYPHQLSGGERQRVAIARALLIKPRLLLMDEPLASLDQDRKQEILPYLEQIHQALSLPILYVSHAADEVARLADHILVMEKGKIVKSGSLNSVLTDIKNPMRIGEDTGVVLEGRIVAKDAAWSLNQVEFAGGSLWVRDMGEIINAQVRVRVLARDISLALAPHEDTSILNRFQGVVIEVVEDCHPAMVLVKTRVKDSIFIARTTARSFQQLGLGPGSPVWLQIKSVAIIC